MSETPKKIVEFRNAGFQIGDAKILDDINLEIRTGRNSRAFGRIGLRKNDDFKIDKSSVSNRQRARFWSKAKATTDWDAIESAAAASVTFCRKPDFFRILRSPRNVALVPELENWDETKKHARTHGNARTRRFKSAKNSRADFRTSFPAVSARASAWRGRSRQIPICFYSTNLSARSMRSRASICKKNLRALVKEFRQNRRFRHARSARSVYPGNADLSDGQRQNRFARNAGKFPQSLICRSSEIIWKRLI